MEFLHIIAEKFCLGSEMPFPLWGTVFLFEPLLSLFAQIENKKRGENQMSNEELRKQVKLLKAFQNITYSELASYLEIKQSSFYSWLKGQYNLGEERQKQLYEIITNL